MDITELCDKLNRELRESKAFRDFIHTRNLILSDGDLLRRLREFKARYRDIERYAEGNPYDDLLRLTQENDDLIHNSVVGEYLKAENAWSRVVQSVVERVSEGLFPEDRGQEEKAEW